MTAVTSIFIPTLSGLNWTTYLELAK